MSNFKRFTYIFSRLPGLFTIAGAFLTSIIILMPVFLIPTSPPFVEIKALTDTLRYYVVRKEIAVISVSAAQIIGPLRPTCATSDKITGLLKPNVGSIIRYRLSSRNISVEFEPSGAGGQLTTNKAQSCDISPGTTLIVPRTGWDSTNYRPLPIAGPAEIGSLVQAPRLPLNKDSKRTLGFLYGGEVRVFGRTWSNELYHAQSAAIKLPAGGLLTSFNNDSNRPDQKNASWYGFAMLTSNGLDVSATTEASYLKLQKAGGRFDQEKFAVGHFTRMINDPILAFPTLFLLIFGVAMQAIASWIATWRNSGR